MNERQTETQQRHAATKSSRSINGEDYSYNIEQQLPETTRMDPDYFIAKLGRTSSSCSSSLFRLDYDGDDISIINDNDIPQVHCCKRLWIDLQPCQPWFSVEDPSTGRKMDVVLTFAPSSCHAMLWKLAAFSIAFGLLFWSFFNLDSIKSWPFYFVHWGLLFTTVYLLLSLFNSIMSSRTQQPPERVNTRMVSTWLFFALAATWSGLAAFLFWLFEFEANKSLILSSLLSSRMDAFFCISLHGPLTLICWLDGLYVNRIPLRWPHLYGIVLPLLLIFVLWVLADTYSSWDLGMIRDDENDNLLYSAWIFVDNSADYVVDDDLNGMNENDDDKWVRSAITSNAAVIGLGSVLYFALWMASRYTISSCCSYGKRLC